MFGQAIVRAAMENQDRVKDPSLLMLTLRKVAVGIKYAVDEGACLRYYGTISNAVAAGKTRGSLLAYKPACLSALEPTWRAGTLRARLRALRAFRHGVGPAAA